MLVQLFSLLSAVLVCADAANAVATSSRTDAGPMIDPGPGCWRQPCEMETISHDQISDSKRGVESAIACQKECKGSCKSFNFNPSPVNSNLNKCDLLTIEDCPKKKRGNHGDVSGPKTCDTVEFCEKLKQPDSSPVALYWHNYDTTPHINPYFDQIPQNTEIHASCGDDKFTAQCTGKTGWKKDKDFTDPTTKEALCPCKQKFEFWYDPNDEEGAEFYCTENTDFSGATPENPIVLDDKDSCVLVCDGYLTSEIMCENGHWTGEFDPEKGVGCYKLPAPKPGPGP